MKVLRLMKTNLEILITPVVTTYHPYIGWIDNHQLPKLVYYSPLFKRLSSDSIEYLKKMGFKEYRIEIDND